MRRTPRIALTLALLAMGACSAPKQLTIRDVLRAPGFRRPPVILMHGVLGAVLADRKSGDVAWLTAPSAFRLAPSADLSLPLTPGEGEDRYRAVGMLERIPVVPGVYTEPIYGPMVDAFREAGYRVGTCDFPRPDEDAWVFSFDFRRDALSAVRDLHRAIERIRELRGDPDEHVAIVAHSFGGLITRYYLMYGAKDVLDEPNPRPDTAHAHGVSHAVYLGTPHRGSLSLFQVLLDGYRVGLNSTLLSREVMATCPLAYQVLPSPGMDLFLDGNKKPATPSRPSARASWAGLEPFRDSAGKPLDLYEIAAWERFDWLPELRAREGGKAFLERSLRRARGWWRALEQEWIPPADQLTLSVGGSTTPTPARAVVLDWNAQKPKVRFDLPESLFGALNPFDRSTLETAGDGRVTLESALSLPYARRLVGISTHDFVHQDPAVLNNTLLFLMGESLLGPGKN